MQKQLFLVKQFMLKQRFLVDGQKPANLQPNLSTIGLGYARHLAHMLRSSGALNDLRAGLILEEAVETCESLQSGDLVGLADGLADLLYVVLGTAIVYGIPIEAVFDIVHRSNMSKGVVNVPPGTHHKGTIKGDGFIDPRYEIDQCLRSM